MTTIHRFETTAEAYDACNTGEVPRGSILVIAPEGVIGVADTWPFAVTEKHGDLHHLNWPVTIPDELREGYRAACRLRDQIQGEPRRFAHTTGLTLDHGVCGIHGSTSGLFVVDDFGNMPEVATFQAVYSALGFEWLIDAQVQ